MQNNSNTAEAAVRPPLDREKIITLSKADLDAVVERAVSQAVAEFEAMFARAVGRATGKGDKWLNTTTAAVVLGKKPEQLRKMVKDGRLRLNFEVRDDRPQDAVNPVYCFNVDKCEKRLLTPLELRRHKRKSL